MLWYKAWLETRWRFGFVVGSILFAWAAPLWTPLFHLRLPAGVVESRLWVGVHMATVILYIFAAIFLAGSGINTQTTYSATTGFHPSMLFTLSLPVSRRRLLFVRAGLGALQTSILVAIMAAYTLFARPEATTAPQFLIYLARAIICTMAVYALSTLLACLFDEMWQFYGAFLFCIAAFVLQLRISWVSWLSPYRGMSLISFPITGPMPWAPVISSLVLMAVLMYASMLIIQRKEY
jgi:ABC-2 type transport system permease protein